MNELDPPPSTIAEFTFQWKTWLNNLYEWLKSNVSKDFFIEVEKGNVNGHSTIHKFGRISGLTSTLTPICEAGFYRTPQVAGVVTLAAISTSTSDTAAGTGARELGVSYLDATGAEQTGYITMNGTTETTSTITGVLRVFRVWVSESGSYATQTTPSQVGTITLRVAGAGATWAQLTQVVTGFGSGQSLIGAYTVPLGKTAYILTSNVTIDSGKSVDIYFFKRENILETAAPYTAMRLQNAYIGSSGELTYAHKTTDRYPELTDIGYMAAVGTGTAEVSVEFELLLVDN